MDCPSHILPTSAHRVDNSFDGLIPTDVSSYNTAYQSEPEADVMFTSGTGGTNGHDTAYMHPLQQGGSLSHPEQSSIADTPIPLPEDMAKREPVGTTLPKDGPILPILTRFPTVNPRSSLGDRFSSINLANASLQYFKDRAQSACETYLPSPLRSAISTSPPPAADSSTPNVADSQIEMSDSASSIASGSAIVVYEEVTQTVDATINASLLCTSEDVATSAHAAALDDIRPPTSEGSGPGCQDGLAPHAASSEVPVSVLSPASVETPAPSESPLDPMLSRALPAHDGSAPLTPALSSAPTEAHPTLSAWPDEASAPAISHAPVLSFPAPLTASVEATATALSPAPALPPASALAPDITELPVIVVTGPLDDATTVLFAGTELVPGSGEDPAICGESCLAQTHSVDNMDTEMTSSPESAVLSPVREDMAVPRTIVALVSEGVAEVNEEAVNVPLLVDTPVDENMAHPLRSELVSATPFQVPGDHSAVSALAVGIDNYPPSAHLPSPAMDSYIPDSAGDHLVADASSDCRIALQPATLEDTETFADTVLHCSPSTESLALSGQPELLTDEYVESGLGSTHMALAAVEVPLIDVVDGANEACLSLDLGACATAAGALEDSSGDGDLLEEAVDHKVPGMAAEDEIHLELPAPASDTADASSPVETTIVSPTCTNETRGDGTAVTSATGVMDSPVVEEGSSVVGFEENGMQVDFAVESTLDEQPPLDDIGLVQRSSEDIPVALASEPTAAADDSPAFDDVAPMQVDDWTDVPAEASVEMQVDEPDLVDDNFAPTSSPLPSSSPPFMSSSPLRSSSPPYIFSSPPRAGFGSSPPSSPVPYPQGSKRKSVSFSFDDESATQQEGTSKTAQKKRALWDVDRSDDTTFNETADASSPGLREIESKRMKLDPDMPHTSSATLPQPKRQTLASQLRQRQKLVAPFRSPLVDKDAARHGVDAVYASGKNRAGLVTTKRDADMQIDDASASMQAAPERVGAVLLQPQTTKDYTPNVAKQFKSPLHLGSSSSSSQPTTAVSSVQAVPTIRALQAQIQTLKQAIKIKTSGGGNDEDELEELVVKWTTVGREVAWAVWDTVKDLDPGEAANMGKVGSSWFDDDKDGRRDGGRGGGWGFDDSSNQPQNGGVAIGEEEEGGSKDDDDEPQFQHTLGTMLRHMGIAPETLGWDEEEGDFVDVD